MQFKQGPQTESLEKPHPFPHSKTEIREAFEQLDAHIEALVEDMPEPVLEQAEKGPTAVQQLQQMVKRLRPLAFALRLPKWSVRLLGQPEAAPRNYSHLEEAYQDLLAERPAALPTEAPKRSATALYEEWQYLLQKTLTRLQKNWSEQQLNAFSLPHSEFGKLSIRENLLLHICQVKRHYEKMETQVEKELQLS